MQKPGKSQRLKGYFCADTVFNLSQKVLTAIEIEERGLGFVPTPNLINEADLRRDFEDFKDEV